MFTMNQEHQRLHAIVTGRVQGVSFRYYTVQKANTLRLCGWVMNRSDGQSVEVIAEGKREDLEEFYTWLHTGSPSARVYDVQHEWMDASGGFSRFEVRYRNQ